MQPARSNSTPNKCNPFAAEENLAGDFDKLQDRLEEVSAVANNSLWEIEHLKEENASLKDELKAVKKELLDSSHQLTGIEHTVNLQFLQLQNILTTFMSGINTSQTALTGEVQKISHQDDVLLKQMKTNTERMEMLAKLTVQAAILTGRVKDTEPNTK